MTPKHVCSASRLWLCSLTSNTQVITAAHSGGTEITLAKARLSAIQGRMDKTRNGICATMTSTTLTILGPVARVSHTTCAEIKHRETARTWRVRPAQVPQETPALDIETVWPGSGWGLTMPPSRVLFSPSEIKTAPTILEGSTQTQIRTCMRSTTKLLLRIKTCTMTISTPSWFPMGTQLPSIGIITSRESRRRSKEDPSLTKTCLWSASILMPKALATRWVLWEFTGLQVLAMQKAPGRPSQHQAASNSKSPTACSITNRNQLKRRASTTSLTQWSRVSRSLEVQRTLQMSRQSPEPTPTTLLMTPRPHTRTTSTRQLRLNALALKVLVELASGNGWLRPKIRSLRYTVCILFAAMVQAPTTSCRLAPGMHASTAIALSAVVTGELESHLR